MCMTSKGMIERINILERQTSKEPPSTFITFMTWRACDALRKPFMGHGPLSVIIDGAPHGLREGNPRKSTCHNYRLSLL